MLERTVRPDRLTDSYYYTLLSVTVHRLSSLCLKTQWFLDIISGQLADRIWWVTFRPRPTVTWVKRHRRAISKHTCTSWNHIGAINLWLAALFHKLPTVWVKLDIIHTCKMLFWLHHQWCSVLFLFGLYPANSQLVRLTLALEIFMWNWVSEYK